MKERKNDESKMGNLSYTGRAVEGNTGQSRPLPMDPAKEEKGNRKDAGKSQSMASEVREAHAMYDDVESLHSEGDEPDLQEFMRENGPERVTIQDQEE